MMDKLMESTINVVKGYNYDYNNATCRNAALDYLRVTIETLDTGIILEKRTITTEIVMGYAHETVNALKLYTSPECFIEYLSHLPLLTKEANFLSLYIIKILKAKMTLARIGLEV